MTDYNTNPSSITRHRTANGNADLEKAATTNNIVAEPNTRQDIQAPPTSSTMHQLGDFEAGLTRFWDRFTRKDKKNIGVAATLRAIVSSSWLNLFVVFLPLAWVAHFVKFDPSVTLAFCFLALVPLEWLFDWGGEQMALYLGTQLGDLVVITLNNVVEATLAIILLAKCELKLLQSTIVGVILLHLLLIPGAAFVTGGAMIMHQDLHPHYVQLNHTLLTIGVLSLLVPAAFFSALDVERTQLKPGISVSTIVSDDTRKDFLAMSHGLAIILLVVYICSRIYLHNPPGDGNSLRLDASAPAALKAEEKELLYKEPKANQYILIVVLSLSITIMAATTEWLVESIEHVRERGHIEQEWFGLILLPVLSWAANGVVAVIYFLRYMFKHFFKEPEPPAELAKARAIDLSIQFTLFWMPFLCLLGWWMGRPMLLLFDFFEIAVLLGATFIVNYVTADAKTNWVEGLAMVAFYVMIALCAWFYSGQPDIGLLLGDPETCGSVAETLAAHAAGSGGGHE